MNTLKPILSILICGFFFLAISSADDTFSNFLEENTISTMETPLVDKKSTRYSRLSQYTEEIYQSFSLSIPEEKYIQTMHSTAEYLVHLHDKEKRSRKKFVIEYLYTRIIEDLYDHHKKKISMISSESEDSYLASVVPDEYFREYIIELLNKPEQDITSNDL